MADNKSKIRTEERLKIKIGEAKNVISRAHGSNTQRDIYCALSLDQEEIFRTCTIEKSLNPFFGEEFEFEVPRKFRYLSVYVYDRDRPSKNDRMLGKVAIKREDLQAFHNKDHWFPIRPITLDSEVQGKIHLNVNFDRNRIDDSGERLRVEIFEACDLTMVNTSCDPFVEVTVKLTNGKQETHRTKVKKKTNCPSFNEEFIFSLQRENDKHFRMNPVDEVEWSELLVTMYHEVSSNNVIFIGEVKISLLGPQQQIHAATNAWYYLQPRKKRVTLRTPVSTLSSAVMDDNCIGTLRLKIQYFVDHILSSDKYFQFRDLILRSPNVQPITSSAVYLLGEIIPCKADVAHCLVRILLQYDQFVPTIRSLAVWEISKVTDTNTIFRGNTLVSKLMDDAMRFLGHEYLHETLRPSIERIVTEHKPCEIDPSRVKDKAVIHQNLCNLKNYVEDIFKAITSSALHCPTIMCQLFHDLKEIAICIFPDNKEIRYSVISGFIFLRFFAPAILGPKLFGLTTEQIDTQTNRTLTLISKTIQSLGNVVCAKTQSCKEEYMSSMYQTFYNETHVTAVRQFLEIISATSVPIHSKSDKPVTLKEGILTKRTQSTSRFRKNRFKQRYFKITTECLSYSKHKGKETICQIPLKDIQSVERVSYESFKRSNMLQVIQPSRILYIQANNCVEEKEWLDLLTRRCSSSDRHVAFYHPGAFIKGLWICCKARFQQSMGCERMTRKSNGIQSSDIDIDRELSRMHTLTFTHMDKIENVLRACKCQAASKEKHLLQSVIEDVQSLMATLSALRNSSFNLEQEQRTALRNIARDTKYGSKQAPIGDDNYLNMAGRLETVTLRKLL